MLSHIVGNQGGLPYPDQGLLQCWAGQPHNELLTARLTLPSRVNRILLSGKDSRRAGDKRNGEDVEKVWKFQVEAINSVVRRVSWLIKGGSQHTRVNFNSRLEMAPLLIRPHQF
jgi:hypothetical protein